MNSTRSVPNKLKPKGFTSSVISLSLLSMGRWWSVDDGVGGGGVELGKGVSEFRLWERSSRWCRAAEVVTPVLVKAPRRKLRRPAASGQFKLVPSWLGDFDSSPKNGSTLSCSNTGVSSTAEVIRAEMMSDAEEVVSSTALKVRVGFEKD
ncbi:hypothetical protein ACFE04_024198 [Oxalis oulophora]